MIRISVPFHGSVPTNRTLSSTGPLSVQLKYRLHASAGSKEVHLIFDRLAQTPKYFKQKRRDIAAKVVEGHVCDEIEDSRHIPSNWREDFLNCRNCK